ncbi:MAG TPA: transcription-repair coupling factor [Clostridiales bacterium]|nr:transcription-repair coupling factor [Clostridiales bacterium]
MLALSEGIRREPEIEELIARIDGGLCPLVLSGLENIHKAHVAATLRRLLRKQVIIICSDELEMNRMANDISSLTEEQCHTLTAREFTFYNAEGVSRTVEQERIKTLYEMATGRASVVVTTPDALMQRSVPGQRLMSAQLTLKLGMEIKLSETAERLVASGYRRSEQVEGVGQFAIHGGILDFYSPALPNPVRCELFGDEIDSMGIFDISTQRRIENITSADILPVAESLAGLYDGGEEGLLDELIELSQKIARRKTAKKELLETVSSDIERLQNKRSFPAADRYMHLLYPEFETAADYISYDAIVILIEPVRAQEKAKNYLWQLTQDIDTLLESGVLDGSLTHFCMDWPEVCEKLSGHAFVMLDSFTGSSYPVPPKTILYMTAKQLPAYGGSMETAASDLVHYLKSGYSTVLLASDEERAKKLKEYLDKHGIPSALGFNLRKIPEHGTCIIGIGSLSAGAEYPGSKIAIITEGQLTGSAKRYTPKRKTSKNRQKIQSYTDLSPGDLVVHEHHGIGRFMGIFQIPVDGVQKDYIKIAYSGTDSLYVPATQLDLVSKYIGSGGEDKPVRLSKLGGTDWQKAKSKAKGMAKELAKKLIELYAARSRSSGFAFSPDSSWQKDFEDSFEYTETEDQLRAITEIKTDMEKPVPMDRLLCGDVGYGKTEVALRAVMKCILDGKQAAILVPTTVLAQQHYVTVMRRFSNFPVRVEVLSRFRTNAEIKQAIRNIKSGAADIIIGTHRLLQKDVEFKDLGLLIVDEEQRFGVTHKERLKEMSKFIDVLTLTATPIPRTLSMALSGIRDMSMIEEPPQDRHPVQTYVLEHDWGVIADAIRRELARGGQVYYLHNRIETIDRTAARLSKLLEGVTIAVAHGQMDEDSLSGIMERMMANEIQILVCTTIIETGIDIPNVNTLIIEDADKLGLGQLHQIRGRVGRSHRRAFAYLTFRPGKVLTEVASKRLAAIREFAEFNSGFKIAMRDLEIRGAGNLLGAEQSGHMLSVGYDMYIKLLEEAILEERGEKPPKRVECSADLAVSANIPERYVPSPEQRMDLYRRIAQIRTEEDADDITDELVDRFGDPPRSVNTLIRVALLRGEAEHAGISEISQKAGRIIFKLTDFDMRQVSALYENPAFKGRIKIEAGNEPRISLKIKNSGDVLGEAAAFVRAYKAAQADDAESGTKQP